MIPQWLRISLHGCTMSETFTPVGNIWMVCSILTDPRTLGNTSVRVSIELPSFPVSERLLRLRVSAVYFNICCELLAYMQVKNDKTKVDYARKGLLEFWDNLPTAEQFINVDRSQFKEVQARTKGQRRLKKIPDRSSMHRFRSLGSPPPPAVAPAIGSAGSGDADDVDAADDADDADGADDADDADDADGVGLSGVNTGVRVGTGAKTGAKTGAGVGIRGSKAARPRAGAASQG